jgi:hypothetical protein
MEAWYPQQNLLAQFGLANMEKTTQGDMAHDHDRLDRSRIRNTISFQYSKDRNTTYWHRK